MRRPVAPRGLARQRVLDAALALFAENGVHGTSLQMIADRVGVGKAAVYYQFKSKEDIALEVIRPSIDDMARVTRIAAALPDWESRRAVAISGLVEMAVRNRHLALMFRGDPAVEHIVLEQPEMKATIESLREMLVGPERGGVSRVEFSVFFAGIGKAAVDPQLSDLDDDELHAALMDISNRIMSPTDHGP